VRVRTLVPEFEAVYFDLADAYLQLNDTSRAMDVLKAAAKRWPNDAEILNAIGTIQVKRGTVSEAIETFTKAVDLEPADGLAYFNLARTYELRYYQLRRFSTSRARWVDNQDDLKKALANYQAYLKIGGPFSKDAEEAVQRLKWIVQ
jgi:tetratricopeptide (TPR) repeat protein